MLEINAIHVPGNNLSLSCSIPSQLEDCLALRPEALIILSISGQARKFEPLSPTAAHRFLSLCIRFDIRHLEAAHDVLCSHIGLIETLIFIVQ